LRLAQKAALVTGASSGIGRACALAFTREGAHVSLVARRRELLQQVCDGSSGNAVAVAADLSAPADIARAVQQTLEAFGRIDVLVNNAGILLPGTAESHSEEEWQRTFDVNLRAAWLLSRAVLPHMRVLGGGSIINMASVLGLAGAKNRLAYAASKGALVMLTRCMAVDHASENIRVNCICPGFVETELTDGMLARSPDPDAERQRRVRLHPLGRLGKPEDVAALAVYLASEESAWVTGAAIPVDGGFTAV
jgi:meso-butanediol dehydrogenase/(S,S)-butanediol dehydrogenase/diacetyl reductase